MIPTPLLLADSSPCLRWLVLRDLFGYKDDHTEVQELTRLREADLIVAEMLSRQAPDGSWKTRDLEYASPASNPILATAYALARLGYLGFDHSHPAVKNGAAYLYGKQRPDGSWPMPGEGEIETEEAAATGQDETAMIPLQTALPLRGLAACGFGTDTRSERAYDWLLSQRLEDGAWPTGIAWGVYRGVGGYRRLAHSLWGCRSNTTAALICLALHPQRRNGAEARRALDLLLGRETQEESTLGFEVARLVGAEAPRGFLTYFARHDLGLMLSLCSLVGATIDDERVAALRDFIYSRQGAFGLWEYTARPQVSRWVTFDILRALARLEQNEGWLSQEPQTPFQPYPRRRKRF